ncbi:hypothetical protein B0H11DRAFT_1929817 [Mycena galericulata]|nr:hypothetical protein B0H11DRAFT_1929817 [Mycena galericulata]
MTFVDLVESFLAIFNLSPSVEPFLGKSRFSTSDHQKFWRRLKLMGKTSEGVQSKALVDTVLNLQQSGKSIVPFSRNSMIFIGHLISLLIKSLNVPPEFRPTSYLLSHQPLLSSTTMAGGKPRTGRPPKRAKRNISGLRNQGSRQSSSSAAPTRDPSPTDSDDIGDYVDSGDSEAMNLLEMDSLMYLEVDSDQDDDDTEADWDEVADEDFQERLLEMIVKMEEDRRDAGDDDWIPTRQAAEAKRRKPEGQFY